MTIAHRGNGAGLGPLPTDERATDPDFFTAVSNRFGPFTLDAAASAENRKCSVYYTAEMDGLVRPWAGCVWCNPPWSNITPWVKRAAEYASMPAQCRPPYRIVMLLPVRSEQSWWHLYVLNAPTEIVFVRGRLRFGGARRPYRESCALVVYRPWYLTRQTQDPAGRINRSSRFGLHSIHPDNS